MELEWRDLAFHREIGAVIEALDSAQFWTRLTRALERYVVFDNWVALRFTAGVAPLVCAESPMPDGTVDTMFQDYLTALYQLDPFYIAATEKPASGFVTLADVAPDNFTMTDYYQRYFRKNIVGDEVHFNYMIDARHTLAFSLGATQRYGERDLAVLALCAPWVIALLRQRLQYETFDVSELVASESVPVTTTDIGAPADTPAYAARFEQVSSVSGRSSYIPQVEDTIWREFRCQSGGRNAHPARRVA